MSETPTTTPASDAPATTPTPTPEATSVTPSPTPDPAPAAETTASTEPPAATTPPPAPPKPTGPSLGERAARKAGHGAEKAARKAGQGIERGTRAAWRGLAERRGLRVALAGAVLLLVALQLGTDSALSVPLLVVGLVMVIAGSMGPRLRGRFSLEFGPEGTTIEVQTHIAAPGKVAQPAPALPAGRPRIALVHSAPAAVEAPDAAPQPAASIGPATDAEPEPQDALVVEGHGETIEMDVEQLRALLAAERGAAS